MPETDTGLVISAGGLVASSEEGSFRVLASADRNPLNADEVIRIHIQNKKLQFAAMTPDDSFEFESYKQGKVIELFSGSANIGAGEF